MASVLMVAGTASDVGKTSVVTGLCRLLARRGIATAPFKAQNMANNSWVTEDGCEIGRAQGIQALAARTPALADMNPVLLKPSSERTSQVVLFGAPVGHMNASEYQRYKPSLFGAVTGALDRLRDRFDVVVIEGAGSPAEINLAATDIVNMRIADHAGAPVLLVGDIDRGGVFAALYGTWALIADEHRKLLRGFLVNKFRGDPEVLGDGFADLERRTGVPTVGVLPWLEGIGLDAEDSLGVGSHTTGASADRSLDIAVVRLPYIVNFTDVDPLAAAPGVAVRFVTSGASLGEPDLIVLPGSKSTVADLEWMRSSGLADSVTQCASRDVAVLGICAGYQILGERISDPHGVETVGGAEVAGIGLLCIETMFEVVKTVRQVVVEVACGPGAGLCVPGYEIHHGRTGPAVSLGGGSGNVIGVAAHGMLEDDAYRDAVLAWAGQRRGIEHISGRFGFAGAREAQIDRLADTIDDDADIETILSWM